MAAVTSLSARTRCAIFITYVIAIGGHELVARLRCLLVFIETVVSPPVGVFLRLWRDFLVQCRENFARIRQGLVTVGRVFGIFLLLDFVQILHRSVVVLVERSLFRDVLWVAAILIVIDFLLSAALAFLFFLSISRFPLIVNDFLAFIYGKLICVGGNCENLFLGKSRKMRLTSSFVIQAVFFVVFILVLLIVGSRIGASCVVLGLDACRRRRILGQTLLRKSFNGERKKKKTTLSEILLALVQTFASFSVAFMTYRWTAGPIESTP